jgi:hypothetical protein
VPPIYVPEILACPDVWPRAGRPSASAVGRSLWWGPTGTHTRIPVLGPALRDDSRPSAERAHLESVITTGAFNPVFQPIVAIGTGSVVGFEALTRFDDGTSPERRFIDASRLGLGTQLELATLRATLEAAALLPGGTYLSVNASPQLTISGELRGALARSSRQLTIELPEHAAVLDYGPLQTAIHGQGRHARHALTGTRELTGTDPHWRSRAPAGHRG